MLNWFYDLRLVVRHLIRRPGFTAMAVSTLALGIGLPATMFSIVHGVLRDLPFDDADELLYITRNRAGRPYDRSSVAVDDFLDWRAQQTSFEDLAAFRDDQVGLSDGVSRPQSYRAAFVSPGTFSLLHVEPVLGRDFRQEESVAASQPVLLLGYSVWQRRYDSDPEILGRTVRLNGESMTVIGVMPEDFRFPAKHDLWAPLRLVRPAERGAGPRLRVFGRLRDGVSPRQAQAELGTLSQLLADAYPKTQGQVRVHLRPFTEYVTGGGPVHGALYTLLGIVSLVLVIACVNVTNLLLVRAAGRGREVAVRAALGAGRGRVVAHVLGESLVLAMWGGILGLGVAKAGVAFFNYATAGLFEVFWMKVEVDVASLFYVAALVGTAGLIAGALPALQASRTDLSAALREGSGGSGSGLRLGRVGRNLVVLEMSLAFTLLVAAGLLIKNAIEWRTLPRGFATASVLTAELDLPQAGRERAVAFFEELRSRLASKPGVAAASFVSSLPGRRHSNRTGVTLEGRTYPHDEDVPETHLALITPGFLDTMAVEAVAGRDIGALDRADSAPVVLVNRRFAERHFGAASPLGERLRLGDADSQSPWREIVGIVPDLAIAGVTQLNADGVYVPLSQLPSHSLYLALRSDGDPARFAPLVFAAVEKLNPDLPVNRMSRLDEAIRSNLRGADVLGTLFGIFGQAALFLAAVGLYGVMAFAVRRRTRELGIRMALGARRAQILGLILRRGLGRLVVGLALGLGLVVVLGQALAASLTLIEPWDGTVVVVVGLVLLLAGTLATWIPAWAAARCDPMSVLRDE